MAQFQTAGQLAYDGRGDTSEQGKDSRGALDTGDVPADSMSQKESDRRNHYLTVVREGNVNMGDNECTNHLRQICSILTNSYLLGGVKNDQRP